MFKYGVFSVRIKFPSGYMGGSVPSFYLISKIDGEITEYDNHDEIDFEFIGGYNAKSSVVHTNLFSANDHWLEQVRYAMTHTLGWDIPQVYILYK